MAAAIPWTGSWRDRWTAILFLFGDRWTAILFLFGDKWTAILFLSTTGEPLFFFSSAIDGPLSFFFSANAGHFANATTHRSTRTPPGMSAINENAGLNPVLLKSFQNGATKKIANDITQGMISDPSTWPPMMYGNPSPPGFLFTLQPGYLPAALLPCTFQ